MLCYYKLAVAYAFALYGFPQVIMFSTEIIALFTLCFGLGYPFLGAIIKIFYSRLSA